MIGRFGSGSNSYPNTNSDYYNSGQSSNLDNGSSYSGYKSTYFSNSNINYFFAKTVLFGAVTGLVAICTVYKILGLWWARSIEYVWDYADSDDKKDAIEFIKTVDGINGVVDKWSDGQSYMKLKKSDISYFVNLVESLNTKQKKKLYLSFFGNQKVILDLFNQL